MEGSPRDYVLPRGAGEVEGGVPVSAEAVEDGVVVVDNRGDAVVVAAEERLSVEFDVGAEAGLGAGEGELVDELHAERADEEAGAREGRDHRLVLRGSGGGRAPTTSPKRGKKTSMLPSIEPHALFPVKCDFVQMYPFAQ